MLNLWAEKKGECRCTSGDNFPRDLRIFTKFAVTLQYARNLRSDLVKLPKNEKRCGNDIKDKVMPNVM